MFDPYKPEFLSAEESYLEQLGQLLDKALAKQIAIKETKPHSLVAPNKLKVSCDCQVFKTRPGGQNSKSNSIYHFPEKVPEDFRFLKKNIF